MVDQTGFQDINGEPTGDQDVGSNGAVPAGPAMTVTVHAVVYLSGDQHGLRYQVSQRFSVPADAPRADVEEQAVGAFLDAWVAAVEGTEPLIMDREHHKLPVALHPEQVVAIEFTDIKY